MFRVTKYLWVTVAATILLFVSATDINSDKVCSTTDKTCHIPDGAASENSAAPPDDNSCVDHDLCQQKSTDIAGGVDI